MSDGGSPRDPSRGSRTARLLGLASRALGRLPHPFAPPGRGPGRRRPVPRPAGAPNARAGEPPARLHVPGRRRHGVRREPAPRRATGGPWTGSSGGRSASTSAATLTSRSRPRRPRNASSARSRWTTASPRADARRRRRPVVARPADHRAALRRRRDPRAVAQRSGRHPDHGADGDDRERGAPGVLRAGTRGRRAPVRSPPKARGGAPGGAAAAGGRGGGLATGPSAAVARSVMLFGAPARCRQGPRCWRWRAAPPSWSGRHAATAGRATGDGSCRSRSPRRARGASGSRR